MQHIVIVGGGAGGVELATRLGRKLGKHHHAIISLIDANRIHIWKPLLHEVATGALNSNIDGMDYLEHAKQHHFRFHLGRMIGLDKENKQVILEAILDDEGNELAPQRQVPYDTLIMAVGSITNDFGTKGAKENCFFLDNSKQANRFHRTLMNEFIRANTSSNQIDHTLNIGIVGAGATGVELSAELYYAAELLTHYGSHKLSPANLRVHVIEAGPRILPALPERIANAVHLKLENLGVKIHTETMVTEVTPEGFMTKSGELIPARIKVWAAGVRGQAFLSELGLETNRTHQLVVNDQLQTSDPDIFAIGDCSALMQKDGKLVPPRAQAAHQQADLIYKNILAKRAGKSLTDYVYRDYGSLVSLSNYSAVGNLLNTLSKDSIYIEGKLAQTMYVSLYRLHQIALHGYWKTFLITLVSRINRMIRPRLKLH